MKAVLVPPTCVPSPARPRSPRRPSHSHVPRWGLSASTRLVHRPGAQRPYLCTQGSGSHSLPFCDLPSCLQKGFRFLIILKYFNQLKKTSNA